MPSKADYSLVVLHEHEIRLAAKALSRLRETRQKAEVMDDTAWTKAVYGALDVCEAALLGAEDDGVCLAITRLTQRTRRSVTKSASGKQPQRSVK